MAHCFTMESPNGSFYDRLKYVIENRNTIELCTSAIKNGDIAFQNYFGGIGVIIEPESIVFSSRRDGGTTRLENGELIFNDEIGTENPDLLQFESDIINRENYNEFIVENYNVTGIFFSQDPGGWPIATQTIKNDFLDFHNRTSDFNLKYYYLKKGNLREVRFDKSNNYFQKK